MKVNNIKVLVTAFTISELLKASGGGNYTPAHLD